MKPLERLGLLFVVIIMIISTISTTIASRQASKAATNSDNIADCYIPNTPCFNIQESNTIRTTAENKCVIDTIVHFPPAENRAARSVEISQWYDECIKELIDEVEATRPPPIRSRK